MKVKDFLKLNKTCSPIYRVIDASHPGFLTRTSVLGCGDKNVVLSVFGEYSVYGFEPAGKNKIDLYVTQ